MSADSELPIDQEGMATVGKMLAETLDTADDVRALGPVELAERLESGRWSTLEVQRAAALLRRMNDDLHALSLSRLEAIERAEHAERRLA